MVIMKRHTFRMNITENYVCIYGFDVKEKLCLPPLSESPENRVSQGNLSYIYTKSPRSSTSSSTHEFGHDPVSGPNSNTQSAQPPVKRNPTFGEYAQMKRDYHNSQETLPRLMRTYNGIDIKNPRRR